RASSRWRSKGSSARRVSWRTGPPAGSWRDATWRSPWAAPQRCRPRCCTRPSASGACPASRSRTSWRGSCCTSSCIVPTPSAGGSRTIGDPDLTGADRAALLRFARATLAAHLAGGLLPPQVATEYHWGPEAFLAATCRKAGLPPDAWREPDTEVLTFQADVFGE